jgi:phosphoribosylformimino-5-aminoimidazole carboxamide ribotide isomerase
MIVIPAIDLRAGQCVRLYQGDFDQQTTYRESPSELARTYQDAGFDNLHVVDLDGARSGEQDNQEIVRNIVESSDLSVQFGGGMRAESQLVSWFKAGVARIVVGTLAIEQPMLVCRWLARFGPERIILALDTTGDASATPYVATHGWTQTTKLTLWDCIDNFTAAGLLHVLCTDISRDGAMTGPNLDLYARLISRYPAIHLQASGGVRHIDDLQALQNIGAHAAICGRALLDGRITFQELTSFLPGA